MKDNIKPYEILQQIRNDKGITLSVLSEQSGYKVRNITDYLNGTYSLLSMPTGNAIKFYSCLGVKCDEFFYTYYPIQNELDSKIIEWREHNPREYDVVKLKKKLYMRLLKGYKRGNIPEREYIALMDEYKCVFGEFLKEYKQIPDTLYDKYIMPFMCKMRISSDAESHSSISAKIYNGIYHTEWSIKEFENICGLSGLFREYRNDRRDYATLSIDSAVKISYVLNIPFEVLFAELF